MSQPALSQGDFGDVTVFRIEQSTLREGADTDAMFHAIDTAVTAGRVRIVLNLAQVEFLSSTVIGRIVGLRRRCLAADGRLALCLLQPPILELMHVTYLADVLPIYEDEAEAIQSFGLQ